MLDFSEIKNEKLRELMQKSAKFNALEESRQLAHINKIKGMAEEKQQKLCEFFAEEKQKESSTLLSDEEKMSKLKKLYEDLVDLEQRFNKLLKKEPENKSRNEDQKTMDDLLKQL